MPTADEEWPYPSYDKISTRLEGWLGDDEAAFRALKSVPWVVTEKIHGSNLCLASDGQQVRVGKRKEWLSPTEDFFEHQRATDPLHEGLRALASSYGARTFVYGELFGGAYPHPDVPAVPGLLPVQTGVYSSPRIEFLAFDLAVLDAGGKRTWVPHEEAHEKLQQFGIPTVPALMRGSYTEVIAYPLGADSGIPGLLGLPALPAGSNTAEGVVLAPERPVKVRGRSEFIRPVLKRKTAAFEEDARYHQAKPWARAPRVEGAFEALCAEASELNCEPRLNAAISKVGRVTDAQRASEVLVLLVQDLLEALEGNLPELLRSLDPAERQSLLGHLRGEATALIELYCGISPGYAKP
jgi:Rnl2 family RNA ligase